MTRKFDQAIVSSVDFRWNNINHTNKPRQNDRHAADCIMKLIFLIENFYISTQISLACVTNSPINKNIKRHTAHIIVSWPNPKQWQVGQLPIWWW